MRALCFLALACLARADMAVAGEAKAAGAPLQVTVGPALSWTRLSGPELTGVMRYSDHAMVKTKRIEMGHFVLRKEGIDYDGIFNAREDGQSIVGVFWPKGQLHKGFVAGEIDISTMGGAAVFYDSGKSVFVRAE